MKKIAFLLLVVLCASFAVAQDAPKFEVFGGYQFTRMGTGTLGDFVDMNIGTKNGNGFNFAATGNLNKYFGITADVARASHSENLGDIMEVGSDVTGKMTSTTYMFGPTFSYRTPKVTPFAHALFGVSHGTLPLETSGISVKLVDGNAFAMAFGGGVDVKVAKHIDIRLGQFDYIRTSHKLSNDIADLADITPADDTQNNFRYSTGIVFKF